MTAPRGESSRFDLIILLSLLGLMPACATLDVSVGPPTFDPEEYAQSIRNGLELRAIPIQGEDRYWTLFDDYLPEIGITAVWAVVRNTGESDIDLTRSKWELRFRGQPHPTLSTDQVFKLYYKRRNIRAYSLGADAKARARVEASSLRLSVLEPRREQAGLLFFNLPLALKSDWGSESILELHNVHWSNEDKADLLLPLNHARSNR